jgi:hypothetical protein
MDGGTEILKYRGTLAQFFFRIGLGFFSWNAGGELAPSLFLAWDAWVGD